MWHGIQGHDAVVERFRRSLLRGRLASTFLFVGPPGIGKRTFALKLAQSLLCQTRSEVNLDPCGHCDSCVQVKAETHPDLILIAKPADKNEIPISAFVGESNDRMRTGLCHDISMRPFMGGRKIAIIDDADALNEEGANSLLKTLEEPPPRSVLILIGTSADKQLPTIRSRAQIIRFQPLPAETVTNLLQAVHGVSDINEARRLAEFSGGSLERAVELADPELWAFRSQILAALAKPRFDSLSLAKPLLAFIDEAGKDAAPRRRRTKQLIGFAADFYRQLLRSRAGMEIHGDDELNRAVTTAAKTFPDDDEAIALRTERCLDAAGYVDRYANQGTLVDAWLDSLR